MKLPVRSALLAAVLCACACATVADEIRLKDGKKLYGVIVAYEDNMFKVKTDYGFVLVEKDKIASIVPTAPAPGATAAARKPAKTLDKKQAPETQTASAPSTEKSGAAEQ